MYSPGRIDYDGNTMSFKSVKNTVWELLSSPRTVGFLKLGAALIAVVHAVEELRDTPATKKTIGFRNED